MGEVFKYNRNFIGILVMFRPIIKTPYELALDSESDNSGSNDSLFQAINFQSYNATKHRNSTASL